jgi:hypothetical protein
MNSKQEKDRLSSGMGSGHSVVIARSGETVCGLCGAVFACERRAGCWCHLIVLSNEARAGLKARTDGCVCPICIETAHR